MNLGKSGEEIQRLVASGGDLIIDFDGNSAYESEGRVFFKPAGAWIHFVTDYLRTLNSENPENVFYMCLKKDVLHGMAQGRYWLYVYDMEFKGFFENRSYEYILSSEDGSAIVCLDEDQKKLFFQEIKNAKIPSNISFEYFDDMQMNVQDIAERRKEEISSDAMSRNSVKIGSRIHAIQNLSGIRIRNLENELMVSTGKSEDRLKKSIERERSKADEKISILEKKLKYVGTYALDAVALVDII